MGLRKKNHLHADEPLPDLQHGIPGIAWQSTGGTTRPQPGRMVPPDDAESWRVYLWILFGLALVLRLLVVFAGPWSDENLAYGPDTPAQLTLAENLSEAQSFGLAAQPAGSLEANVDALRQQRGELRTFDNNTLHPEFYRTPGYPALLALAQRGLPGLPWWLLVQCVLGALCVPLTYRVGRGLLNRKMPALIGAAVVALHPAMIIAPAALTGDVATTLLVLVGLWAVVHVDGRSLRHSFAGGFTLGLAALFSPLMFWLSPLAAAWLIVTERRLRTLGLAAALMLGAALPVGAWMYRNQQQGLGPRLSAQPIVDRYFGSANASVQPTSAASVQDNQSHLLGQLKTNAGKAAANGLTVFEQMDASGNDRLAADRAGQWRAMRAGAVQLALGHSVDEAFGRLDLDYAPGGFAAVRLGEVSAKQAVDDPAIPYIINTWVGVNATLLAGMAVGAGLMLWRQRWAGLMLALTVIGLFVYASADGANETMRLPLIGLQGLLLGAIWAPGPRLTTAGAEHKPKLRKPEKLSDKLPELEPATSPLATATSLRPGVAAIPALAGRRPDASAPAPSDPQHALHPMLRGAPPAEAEEEPAVRPLMFTRPI